MPGAIATTRIPFAASSASRRQRQTGDALLDAAYAAWPSQFLECRDRGRVDDNAPFAVVAGRVLLHDRGDKTEDVEGADQVDADHPAEIREDVRAVLAEDLLAVNDAGALDADVDAAEFPDRDVERGLNAGLVGDVDLDEAGPELGRQGRAAGLVPIRDEDPAAGGDDAAHARLAEARGSAGHERRPLGEFHGSPDGIECRRRWSPGFSRCLLPFLVSESKDERHRLKPGLQRSRNDQRPLDDAGGR